VTLLEVRDLHTQFDTRRGVVRAVDGVSFELNPGETLGLVGESGCGKSATALSLMRLVPVGGRIAGGEIVFEGRNILELRTDEMRAVRGNTMAMIFQDPMTSLNPVVTIGRQMSEAMRFHLGLNRARARRRAVELLELVGVPGAQRRLDDYPHQFSGGMRQRVMIATALSCEPKLIIADEITTALDVTTQAQILDLLEKVAHEFGTSFILITHDLGIVAEMAHRVHVMYAGRIVERASVTDLFTNPRMPYTWGLLSSSPRLDEERRNRLTPIKGAPPDLISPPPGCHFGPRCAHARPVCGEREPDLIPPRGGAPGQEVRCLGMQDVQGGGWLADTFWSRGSGGARVDPEAAAAREPVPAERLLEVKGLSMHYPLSKGIVFQREVGAVQAVDGVDFYLERGETLGLVGESGCGKSTTGRAILQFDTPTTGSVSFDSVELTTLDRDGLRRMRRRMQMIFQNSYASLNPRMTVGKIVGEPLEIHDLENGRARVERVKELLDIVGLDPSTSMERFPREFSGGQRQRIGIARALAVKPELIVADEPISALDVSVQAQIINLLEELQEEFRLTYLFIAHDLAVVRHIADRVAVMYLGKIVELAAGDELYGHPLHPYTVAFLSSVPTYEPEAEKDRRRIILKGEVPSPVNPPSGCRFHTRCWLRERLGNPENCVTSEPELRDFDGGHRVACHWVEKLQS